MKYIHHYFCHTMLDTSNNDLTTFKALIATVGHLSKFSLNLKTMAEIFLTCTNTRIQCCHPKFARPIYDIFT
jgi:hypothetical protein